MKMMLLMLTLLFLAPPAALQGNEARRRRCWPLQIKGMIFPRLELALTAEEQRTGLMGRPRLEEEEGMLFVQQEPQILSFWMKNTLIPLDLIYLDANGTIVKIWQMPVEPPQTASETMEEYHQRLPCYSSEKPAAFALELKAGMVEILELKPGDRINLGLDQLLSLIRQAR